jgi:uncharacterized protein (TIGR00255 family)
MTGFGAGEGTVGRNRVSVEIRSVNHRFFNPSIKLPNELSRWEAEVREALRRCVVRGHVTLSARVQRHNDEEARINEERFGSYLAQMRKLHERFDIASPVDVAAILRLPDVIATEMDESTGTPEEFIAIVSGAVDALDRMRIAEGAKLASYVEARLAIIAAAVERIAERAPQRLVEQRDRLRASVQEIASGVAVDDQRLAQEIAILADRLDVSEEISRFHAHLGAVASTLGTPPADGVGKRLGFLLQELLREANTTGSKANDAVIVRDVILIKEELERIREQVENLE